MKFSRLIILLTAFCSCSFFEPKEEKQIIARVGSEYLFLEDIETITVNLAKEDSAAKVEAFVDNWIKEQLLLQKAMDNLSEKQANFEEQLKNYKNSLLIYTFENELVKQKLDTVISERELRSYYNKNKANFNLREDIVQVKFVNFLNAAPEQDSLSYWLFQSKDEEESRSRLSEYCTQFASNCHLDTSMWIPFTKIKELVQLPADKNLYLSVGKNEFSDSLQTSLLKVYNTKKEGNSAPYSYVKNQLKSILLNKRKIQLIAKVKDEIFEDATLNKEYEIYE